MGMRLQHFDHVPGARFITFCTHQKLPIFTDDEFYKILIDSIKISKDKYKFKLLGYVFMPEHVHLVIVPIPDSKVGQIIGKIKSDSGKNILDLLRKCNSPLLDNLKIIRNRLPRYVLWQRRCYDHNCRSKDGVWEKINYCHNNPVKRGLVEAIMDWHWSSARFYSGLKDIVIDIDI